MWLYLPSIPSPSAPESAGLTLGSVWQFRTLARSVTWRGKQLPPRAWSRRLKQGGFIRLLSGLTCEPLMLARGADAWISSLRATRARATALPGSGLASLTIAGCSIAPSKSLMPAGLVISSARTCRGTRTDSSPLPSRHWNDWAAALRAEYSARPKPETPCGASDCSSWPSARVTRGAYTYDQGDPNSPRPTLEGMAEQWMAPVADDTGTRSKRYGQGGMALSMQATNWAAPRTSDTNGAGLHGDGGIDLRTQAVQWAGPKASDPEKAGPNMRDSKGDIPLPAQAANWPAPTVQDHKGSSEGSITRQDGKSRADMLDYAAEQFFRPPSFPAPAIAAGSMSSTASPNTNQHSVRRKLNPIFVEALMRWPTGLSGFERQETAWTRWWLLMPSCVSELVSDCGPTEQMDLFGEAA